METEKSTVIELPQPKTFIEAAAIGRDLVEQQSKNQFRLGWLANTTPSVYGQETRKRLAEEIDMEAATLTRYAWVADAFDPMTVAKYPHLKFTYFEVVRKLADEDYEEALDFLERAETMKANGDRLTVEEFKKLVNPTAVESQNVVGHGILVADLDNGVAGVKIDGDFKKWLELAAHLVGDRVKITIGPDKD